MLDTHALLWWLSDDAALSSSARRVIGNTRNVLIVSAASAWEVATKVRLGKLPAGEELAADFENYVQREGFEMLPISGEHAIRAAIEKKHNRPARNLTCGDHYGKHSLARLRYVRPDLDSGADFPGCTR